MRFAPGWHRKDTLDPRIHKTIRGDFQRIATAKAQTRQSRHRRMAKPAHMLDANRGELCNLSVKLDHQTQARRSVLTGG